MTQLAQDGMAQLERSGILAASGADARAFLHAQLTNDIEHLDSAHARVAGWCSAKGRLLASLIVVPHDEGFLLQLSRDIAASTAKRLSLFVMRAKVKLADDSDRWKQYGVWGPGSSAALRGAGLPVPAEPLACATAESAIVVAIESARYLVLSRGALPGLAAHRPEDDWELAEIRAGRPTITQATQDLFVPQMANFEVLGAVDFKKGCYPGQEIVARTQYRGILKRRMYHVRAGNTLRAGQGLYSDDLPGQASGTVVNAVGHEGLAVLQIASVAGSRPFRTELDGAPLEVLPLPYAI